MTSPDFRRMAAASSPTVTDSGTLISSRLISCGSSSTSSGGAGFGSTFGEGGATAVMAGAGLAAGAGVTGRGATIGTDAAGALT